MYIYAHTHTHTHTKYVCIYTQENGDVFAIPDYFVYMSRAFSTLEGIGLRCVAVCCSLLQSLQCVAVCCTLLQFVVVSCNLLECVAIPDYFVYTVLAFSALEGIGLRCVQALCSMLQSAAPSCSLLQSVAVCVAIQDYIIYMPRSFSTFEGIGLRYVAVYCIILQRVAVCTVYCNPRPLCVHIVHLVDAAGHRPQVEILKRQLATHLTVQHNYPADFSEFLSCTSAVCPNSSVIQKLFQSLLATQLTM